MEGITTIKVLKKKSPTLALFQARTKLSQRNTAGGAQGLKKSSWSVLSELKIIQTIGKITATAQNNKNA